MNSRQKRSSGGYGLRRKVAKKRLDEDFEYYFSKVGPSFETKPGKGNDRTLQEEVFITDVKTNTKVNMKNADSPEKRPRGRPRKMQMIPSQEPDISESNLKFVDLKEKRCRKSKIIFVEQNDPSKEIEDYVEKVDVITEVACEEEVEDESVDKRLKLDAVLSEEITELREEEVSSIPEGEKENLPEEGVSLDSYSEDRIIVPIGVEVQYEGGEGEVELYDGEEVEKSYALIQKSKRKYRRNRLSQETIRRLSELSPDDKIECNECHKLLKPSSFRQHLRTHTGEKPFGCEVCEARFTRKGDVERHVRIVHNKQKPYKCCRCQRAFGDKKNLRWHLMNHDKKLFYVCEVCRFKFGKREYWENHVRYIHPLPGGIDPSEAATDDGEEERLQALTDSLLEEESRDEPSHDNESCDDETSDTFVADSVGESVDCTIVKREGLNTIPFKCLPGVVKVSDSKENDLEDTSNICVENNETSGVEAVVIQINNLSDSCENKKVIPMKVSDKVFPTNIIRVIAPRNTGQFRQDSIKHEQPIVIDTREDVSDGEQETPAAQVVQILVPDQTENEVNDNNANQEPSKIISIVLNEEQTPKLNKSSPLSGVTSFPFNIR